MKEDLYTAIKLEVEKPNNDCSVEWWFYNGYFSGTTISKHYFMVSFFRHNTFNDDGKLQQTSYSLLYSLLNPETGENKTVSRIDDKVIDAVLKVLEEKSKPELDLDLYSVIKKELTEHDPPIPIELGKSICNNFTEALDIDWGDFSLKQIDEHFEIKLPLLEAERSISLKLYPLTERFDFVAGNEPESDSTELAYRCYPKLGLEGKVENQNLNGEAWMDHQWGNPSWFFSEREDKQVLGWDWFGINLDDGTDLVFVIHKLAKTKELVYKRAILMKPGGEIEYYKNVVTTPIKYWESPRTHIKYPIEWKLEVADIDLSLTFSPIAEDQEIQVLGLSRAIWEGAGNVAGQLNGKEIAGRGRGEFFGYGYIFDFQSYLKNLAEKVDKRIEELLPKVMTEDVIEKWVGKPYWKNEPNAYTEMINKPVWDLILRKGKRWRPIFGLLMHEALGGSSLDYERFYCIVELIHSGALIIDDIEDSSELRRGEPALHLKYGLDVALNAGNALYFIPKVEIFYNEHLNDAQRLRIYQIKMNTYLQAHMGQTLDIYWSRNMSIDNLSTWLEDDIEEKILQMYDYKTAAGPKGLAEVASVLTGSDKVVEKAAVDFTRAFAVAFQIIDDVHNFSDSPRWTKVCGEDIVNGKITYVVAKAIKLLKEKESKRLKEILCNETLRKEKAVLNEAINLVRTSGALEKCKQEAKKMSLNAWDNFAKVVPSCEPKIMLNMLCLKMLDLAYDT